VREGKFYIYPISTVEEGIEILTGIEAGKRKEDGTYDEETVFWRVDQNLKKMAEHVKAFMKEEK
ncbi:MAG: hypothetical protein Q7J61_01265, partial [Deltaproteobacteria bacterium]|nr:hypothetical protein [Deltaproteobacteria bacterium]